MTPVTGGCRENVRSDTIHLKVQVHVHVRYLGAGGCARAGARGAACELGRGGDRQGLQVVVGHHYSAAEAAAGLARDQGVAVACLVGVHTAPAAGVPDAPVLASRPPERRGQMEAGQGTRWAPAVAPAVAAHARSGPRADALAQRAHGTAAVRTGSASGGAVVGYVAVAAGATSCATAVRRSMVGAGGQRACAVRGAAGERHRGSRCLGRGGGGSAAEPCAVYGEPWGEYAGDGATLGNGDVIAAGLLRLSEGGGRPTGTVDGASFQPPLSLLIGGGGPAFDGVPFAIRLGGGGQRNGGGGSSCAQVRGLRQRVCLAVWRVVGRWRGSVSIRWMGRLGLRVH